MQGAKCTSSRGSSKSNLIEPSRTTELTEPSPMTALQGKQGVQGAICTSSGRFKCIEPHRTFSIYPHHYRESKVCSVLAQEFGVVRLYETSSFYIATWKPRCAGCLCPSSVWFKHIEPPRTFSSHSSTEVTRCGRFCHLCSGWFDCTEPSLSTRVQEKQGVQVLMP